MREIKFRGKAKINKPVSMCGYVVNPDEWVTTDKIINAAIDIDTPKRTNVEAIHEFWHLVDDGWIDPETVGQWTGLKDKNGVDIYEGDILQDGLFIAFCDKCKSFEPFWYSQEDTIESRYLGECFNCDGEVGWWELIDGPNEVIGNIHEKGESK